MKPGVLALLALAACSNTVVLTGDGPPPEGVRRELEWILTATYLGWKAIEVGGAVELQTPDTLESEEDRQLRSWLQRAIDLGGVAQVEMVLTMPVPEVEEPKRKRKRKKKKKVQQVTPPPREVRFNLDVARGERALRRMSFGLDRRQYCVWEMPSGPGIPESVYEDAYEKELSQYGPSLVEWEVRALSPELKGLGEMVRFYEPGKVSILVSEGVDATPDLFGNSALESDFHECDLKLLEHDLTFRTLVAPQLTGWLKSYRIE